MIETKNDNLIADLVKAKAIFQRRAILAVMGIHPDQVEINLSNSTPLTYCDHCQEQHVDGELFCDACGDHHEIDKIPYGCQTGDGI